jgi:hypothetical protein
MGLAFVVWLARVPVARADLVTSFQFNGRGNWSIDGGGAGPFAAHPLRAVVPSGSTVLKAFL